MFSIHPSWPLVSIVALQEWFTKEYAIVGPKCFPVDADRMDLIAGQAATTGIVSISSEREPAWLQPECYWVNPLADRSTMSS
jgi:hypothetical protein